MPVVQWFYPFRKVWKQVGAFPCGCWGDPPKPRRMLCGGGSGCQIPIVDGTRNILSPNDMRAFTEKYYSSLVLGTFEFEESFWRFSSPSFPPLLIRRLRNNLLTDSYELALGIPLIEYSREVTGLLYLLCVYISQMRGLGFTWLGPDIVLKTQTFHRSPLLDTRAVC